MVFLTPLIAIPLIGLALIAALAAFVFLWQRAHEQPLRPSDLAWMLPGVVALVMASVVCGLDLYENVEDVISLVSLDLAALLQAACALLRRRLLDALDRRDQIGGRTRFLSEAARVGIALLALASAIALGRLALELPWNSDELFGIKAFNSFLELAIIAGLLALLYLLFQRRGAGIALGVGALFVTGLAQFFVARFKGAPILPNDLLVLGTAAAVSGTYTYSVDSHVVQGLTCAVLAMAPCALVAPSRIRDRYELAGNVGGNLLGAFMVASCLWAGLTVPDYFEDLGVKMQYWTPLPYYKWQGFLPTFVAVAQDIPVEKPQGYTPEGAAEVESEYVAAYDAGRGSSASRAAAEQQFSSMRPSIVCIMNETFADLSYLYDGLGVGYEGPAFYRQLQSSALSTGSLAVSVRGAGTCNTEFEFLTGSPLAYVGDGKYPYSLYSLTDVSSLPRQLAELGYETTAMHPNLATNWSRDKVYPALGFDEFLDIEDFEGAPGFHSGVTDGATYDKVLEILRSSSEPQFIFDVTMQNHSSYAQRNIPAEQLRGYTIPGLDSDLSGNVNEYLACIDASDRDLQAFIEELSQLERPVIVVFFGDHQPNFADTLVEALYPAETAFQQAVRSYPTTYSIWANYDVAGSVPGTWQSASPADLASMALEIAGAPLTDYEKTQLVARESMPALSLVGLQTADGTWHETDDPAVDPATRTTYEDLALVHYLERVEYLE